MDIKDEVIRLTCGLLNANPREVGLYTEFKGGLRADSLDILELIQSFEERFDIEIPDGDIPKLITINDAIMYLEERL